MADIHRVYRNEPSLWEVDFEWQGFEWLESHDNENSVFAYMRKGRDPQDVMVVACNFTPLPRYQYRVGVPVGGLWREVLNTDSSLYTGSNVGNGGQLWALDEGWSGRPHSLCLTLPPLGAVYLKPGQK